MNTQLPALLAAELDALTGPDQLARVAELLRHMAESLEPGYRPSLLNAASDYEGDAETLRESEQFAAHKARAIALARLKIDRGCASDWDRYLVRSA